METEIIKSSKYSIELKQSTKKEWYIGSIKINSDNKEELKDALDDAVDLATKKLNFLDNPSKIKDNSKDKEDVESMDEGLFTELRMVRQRFATFESVPAFVIFHDSTLKEMTKIKPITKEGFVNVKGSSENKYEKYGEEFIRAIKNHLHT